jgi:hypothetical protein
VLQRLYKTDGRSQSVKRTQKGSEDEAIVGGPATLNGISPEIW